MSLGPFEPPEKVAKLGPFEAFQFWLSEDVQIVMSEGAASTEIHAFDNSGTHLAHLGVFRLKADAMACLPMILDRITVPALITIPFVRERKS